jgi:Flp pilus assembly protein TadD
LFAAALCLGALGGCKNSLGDVTGSINPAVGERQSIEELGRRYERNPSDAAAAMAYARALRAQDQNAQAVAVLQSAAARSPNNLELIGAYGKALADAGRLQEAQAVLPRAHTPERPSWSVLSAQGAVADQLGEHERAQNFYLTALKIVPNEPSVMSNLGLSYALSRNLKLAEETLRRAADQPRADQRVRQNLALVLALQGKFQEAEAVSRRDLSPADAADNIATIRRTIAESNTWRQIQQSGQPQPPKPKRG